MTGMIYTFYSYKGGVGRSMALANLGALFFREGYTTLLIDWDLEAPGLERYFEQSFGLDLASFAGRPGVVDLIGDYMARASGPAPEDEAEPPFPEIGPYLCELDRRGACQLLLMGAGRRAGATAWARYAEFVQTFDWGAFYQDWEGGLFFEWLRGQLKARAEIVLIDSRTGVTEMGGVATQHLADAVILLCGSNMENIVNTARMGRHFSAAAVQQARGGRPLDVLVVPSRIDDSDSEGYGTFLERLDHEFAWLPLDAGDGPRELILPYLPAFSFVETLVVGDPEAEQTAGRLLEGYRRLRDSLRALAHDGTALKMGWPSGLSRDAPVVYLASARDGVDAARQLAGFLAEERVEARIADPRRIGPEREVADLAQAHGLVVILTMGAVKSKFVGRLVAIAEDLGKPIIPVLREDVKVPLTLSAYHHLDMRFSIKLGMATLIRSIRTLCGPARGPEGPASPLVYVGYSPADGREDADRVARYLSREGYRTWRPSDDLLPGMVKDAEIEKALGQSVALVALITPGLARDVAIAREGSYMRGLGKPIIPLIVQQGAKAPLALADLQPIDCTRDFSAGLRESLRVLRGFALGL